MTADSIRGNYSERIGKNETADATTQVLVEIAAQLAELNERMDEVVTILEHITNANGFRTLYVDKRV